MLDAGADAGIMATSSSIEGVFIEAALGMYSMAADLKGIEPSKLARVEVGSHSIGGLLVAWLNELVYLMDARDFVASKVEVTLLDPEGFHISAVLAGEEAGSDRLGHGLLIKAATYHGLSIENENGLWSARVTFDI